MCEIISDLLRTITNGSSVLYKIEHAYIIFDMNVTGDTHFDTSITYNITVGPVEASVSVIIDPRIFFTDRSTHRKIYSHYP